MKELCEGIKSEFPKKTLINSLNQLFRAKVNKGTNKMRKMHKDAILSMLNLMETVIKDNFFDDALNTAIDIKFFIEENLEDKSEDKLKVKAETISLLNQYISLLEKAKDGENNQKALTKKKYTNTKYYKKHRSHNRNSFFVI